MAKEAGDSVRTKRDAVLFAWRAHNRVNARLAAAEARGERMRRGAAGVAGCMLWRIVSSLPALQHAYDRI